MGRLLLARHGQVQSGDVGRYLGQSDPPLDAEGVAQAEKLRDHLASEMIQAVYTSNLKRALQTAEVITAFHRAPLILCPDLREIDFGEFEGMTFAEIEKCYPEATNLWSGSNPKLSFPGGESLDALATRVSRFLAELVENKTSGTVLVVAHLGSLRMLVCQLLGLDLARWWQIRLDRASLTVIETYPEGAVLCLLNDICHLTGFDQKPNNI